MTSFPAAISYAAQAIQSILNGSVLPDKVVLYLTLSRFGGEEPSSLHDLFNLSKANKIFEIRNYDPDIRSYQKLIPALTDFPEAAIVTTDDDVVYHRHMLRDLLRLHQQIPTAILAHRARRIKLDKPYRQWPKYHWYHFLFKKIHSSFMNLQTGVGGVLYPPHSLKQEMLAWELFTQIAPTTDDIWFWAAAVANGTPIVPVPFGYNKTNDLDKPYKVSLKTINYQTGPDKNAATLKSILEKFPEIREKLTSSIYSNETFRK